RRFVFFPPSVVAFAEGRGHGGLHAAETLVAVGAHALRVGDALCFHRAARHAVQLRRIARGFAARAVRRVGARVGRSDARPVGRLGLALAGRVAVGARGADAGAGFSDLGHGDAEARHRVAHETVGHEAN